MIIPLSARVHRHIGVAVSAGWCAMETAQVEVGRDWVAPGPRLSLRRWSTFALRPLIPGVCGVPAGGPRCSAVVVVVVRPHLQVVAFLAACLPRALHHSAPAPHDVFSLPTAFGPWSWPVFARRPHYG